MFLFHLFWLGEWGELQVMVWWCTKLHFETNFIFEFQLPLRFVIFKAAKENRFEAADFICLDWSFLSSGASQNSIASPIGQTHWSVGEWKPVQRFKSATLKAPLCRVSRPGKKSQCVLHRQRRPPALMAKPLCSWPGDGLLVSKSEG